VCYRQEQYEQLIGKSVEGISVCGTVFGVREAKRALPACFNDVKCVERESALLAL
jgi:hypothetical protein